MSNIERDFQDWGVLFTIYKQRFFFENGVMRIKFEIKTEEAGIKVCIMWTSIIYSACQILVCPRTVAKLGRYVECLGVNEILKIFLTGRHERNILFRRPV